jgi:hypothetical protein
MIFFKQDNIKIEWKQFKLYLNFFNKKLKFYSQWYKLIEKNKLSSIQRIVSKINFFIQKQRIILEKKLLITHNFNIKNNNGLYDILIDYINLLKEFQKLLFIQSNLIKSKKWEIYTKLPELQPLLQEEKKLIEMEDNILNKIKIINKIPYITEQSLTNYLSKNNLLFDDIKKVIHDVNFLHSNQKRDTGSSYIEEHIFPVTMDVINYYLNNKHERPSTILIASSLLHDSLEDTNISEKEFIQRYGSEVYNIVIKLTKKPWQKYVGENELIKKKNREEEYFKFLEKSDLSVMIIKFHDRLNNLSTLLLCPQEKIIKYISETQEYILPLAKKYSPYHYKQLKKTVEKIKKTMK